MFGFKANLDSNTLGFKGLGFWQSLLMDGHFWLFDFTFTKNDGYDDVMPCKHKMFF
jgi:hypothetical protein